jgi:SAM-dependent methyltransferase
MGRKYYESYEDRYKQVYSQGLKYWSSFPEEVAEELGGLDAFLSYCEAKRGVHQVLEPGCGEGHLALALAQKGYEYLGIDLAPSAIDKASRRIAEAGLSHLAKFVLHDSTDLSFLPPGGFDLALDNKFLHMLVVDQDRETYLNGLHAALRPGSWVMFNELYREGAYAGPITSFDQYLEVFEPDLSTIEERTAYNDGVEVKVRIPRVPARFKDEAGYAAEMKRAGFALEHFQVLQTYMGCRFYARA